MKPRPEDVKAALYGRFSDEMQSAHSADDQLRVCGDICKRHGWAVAFIERDEAVRAGATASREGFERLLAHARAGRFNVLVVEDVSRFSRVYALGTRMFLDLAEIGVFLADKGGLYDPNDPMDRLRFAFGLNASHEEVKRLGERSRRGQEGRLLARESPGGAPPFGLKAQAILSSVRTDRHGRPELDRVVHVPDPDRAPIVRQVFEWFAAGESKSGIARRLNAAGVRTARAGRTRKGQAVPNSGLWSAAQIGGLLANQRYVGRYTWGRTERSGAPMPLSGKKKQAAAPDENVHTVEEFNEAIVDRDLWDAVQKRLAEDRALDQRQNTARVGRKFLLSGLIVCSICGHRMVIGAPRRGLRAYRCPTSHRAPTSCANRTTVPQEPVEARVKALLDTIAKNPDRLRDLVAEHNKRIVGANASQLAAVHEMESRITKLRGECAHLGAAIAEGHGSTTLATMLVAREKEIGELEGKARDARDLLAPLLLPSQRAVHDFVTGHASFFDAEWLYQREFIERVVERIVVYADGSIVVRFAADSLFAPVADVELVEGAVASPSETAGLAAKRAHLARLVRDTREWSGSDAISLQVGDLGFAMARAPSRPHGTVAPTDDPGDDPRNRSGKTLNVPRGIRTLVATVKGWSPGPLDDGDGGPGRWAVQGSNLRPSG